MIYLEDIDSTAPEFGDFYDELPLWSARFGLMLLDEVELRPGMTILDVGAGTGFLAIELAQRCGAPISIDTAKAEVAAAALEAGAVMINDVTALRGDADMAGLAAKSGAGLVLMHMLGAPRTMQQNPRYADVVAEVRDFLARQAAAAVAAGVGPECVVVDPGIGFGKTIEHNLELIRNLGALKALGHPVLLGASRKAFIGALANRPDPLERLWGSVGVHVLGAALGADLVRVHDVAPLKEALAVTDAVMAARVAP